jgi:tripartite-type tricarboxylate transporter receptor subunit TctC
LKTELFNREEDKMALIFLCKREKNPFVSVKGISFLLLIISCLWSAPEIGAKEYPVKAINLIVPWSAGASTDITARIMAPALSKVLGAPVSVIDKPGGSGTIGTLEAVKAAPDGYTILVDCGGTSSIQYAWAEKLPYNVEERVYMARAILSPMGLSVRGDAPWKTIDDLVADIRKNPSAFRWSLIGGTGVPDVLIAQLRAALMAKGVDLSKTRTVTYKGTGEVMIALGGGHVDIAFASPSATNSLWAAGKVRPLAISGKERYKGWPDIPSTAELGYPTVNLTYWAGYGAPPGLPPGIVKTWIDAVRATVKDPEVISKFESVGFVPAFLEGEDFKKFVLEEGKSIKGLKLK